MGAMTREWMELRRCQNPHCWRHFMAALRSTRECCDTACEQQRRAWEAREARVGALVAPAS